jgi:hypothetical protein
MQSHEHAGIGGVIAVAVALWLWGLGDPLVFLAAVGFGVFVSVFVDLDHFVLARYYTGDWSVLRTCLTDPVYAFTRQEAIFADLPDMEHARLASHVVIVGLAVPSLAVVRPTLATFTLVVLVVHVGCDLLRDHGLV